MQGDSKSDSSREVFVPLAPDGVTNPHIKVTPPSPDIIIYRLEESFVYPNSSQVNSTLFEYVKENMRRGKDMTNVKAGDRPWNDPGPGRHGTEVGNETKPDLRAIVLDFSAM
jgi:solute carrier family 26 (sodium-independent sulfate anion transporter), member 11